VFTSFGAPFFAEYLARTTGGDFLKPDKCLSTSKKNKSIDLFVVGMYYPLNSFYQKIGRFRNVIILFAGSDILKLKSYSKQKRDKILKDAGDRGAVFATESPIIQDHIKRKFNIDTEVIYLPSSYKSPKTPTPHPDKFSIGCYMPCAVSKGVSKRYFYGFSTILEVVKKLPEVDFHFYSWNGYADIENETSLSNFISYGDTITDMSSFLRNISCGLRIAEHDTYSMSAIEYVMEARWFINNHKMPYCEKISHNANSDEIIDVINVLKKRDGINIEGKKFYDKNHSVDLFKNSINNIFKR
jgi:hypothetical protein